MVGLSVVLENQKLGACGSVINKATMILSSSTLSSAPSHFLHQCFLCRNRLLPGKDIYMYKGDRGFCSVECRDKQIFMDEEESIQREICSLAAMKTPTSSPASSRGHWKGPSRKRAAGGFAY